MSTAAILDSQPGLTIVPPVPADDHASGGKSPDLAATKDERAPNHRKIAKLPKPLRDRINLMLDEGLSAREIIQSLHQSSDPPLPYAISEMCISRWRDTGYRRYLAQQERLALVQANREGAQDIIATDDT